MKKRINLILGLLLFVFGSFLLWYNEQNNIKDYKIRKEIKSNVRIVNSNTIDIQNNDRLIFLSGKVYNHSDYLIDEQVRLQLNALKMVRKVEIYQWNEYVNAKGKTSYKKIWEEGIIDSTSFLEQENHQNPSDTLYTSTEKIASDIYVGSYLLSEEILNDLPALYQITDYPENLVLEKNFKIQGNYITNCKDENNPSIGDIRISYYYYTADELTLIAKQMNNGFIVQDQYYKVKEGLNEFHKFLNIYNTHKNDMIFRVLAWLICSVGFYLLLNNFQKISIFQKMTKKYSSTNSLSLGGIWILFLTSWLWLSVSIIIFIILILTSMILGGGLLICINKYL